MSVLLMQLAGPLQSWGASARFARRTTESAPTKSGIVGLLAAAQGRAYDADIWDLAALRFGVRIDQPGRRVRDFQTACHQDTGKSMPVSERYYLADAVFVAGVEGDDGLIEALDAAVREPVFLPYLGRRSCPPAKPIDLGIRRGTDLVGALTAEAWRASDWYQEQQQRGRRGRDALALLMEAAPGDGPGDTIRDQPLSFDPRHRRYGLRTVVSDEVRPPPLAQWASRDSAQVGESSSDAVGVPDHDPTSVLDVLPNYQDGS